MSLEIKQREEEWIVVIDERWIFQNHEEATKVMRYLCDKNVPFNVSYGIGIFISMKDVQLKYRVFDDMTTILLELLKLKKAFGGVVKVEREAHGRQF